MRDRRGSNRWTALTALVSALAWSPPTFGVEADAEASGAASEDFVYHTVEPGESVWEIATRYGSSVAAVIRENGIEDPRGLWVGTRLRVPVPSGANSSDQHKERGGLRHSKTAEIAALLDRCEAELGAARFERALASASEARDRIDSRNDAADDPSRVRLEIASATAYVALGQDHAALESLERALVADPDLELDPALTSPKVLAVFRVARGRVTPMR